MYAITRHQPWESLIAPGIKTVETRPWPAAARLVGLTIAIHAGQRVVKGPGDAIRQELRTRLGEDWSRRPIGPDRNLISDVSGDVGRDSG